MYSHSTNLVRYVAPKWAEGLRHIPEFKIALGQLNTPIHQWRCPGISADVQLYIKRDDMTGSTMSGNKVRKLEFIMAEAIRSGCRHVITCGGVQSNFCRAVAVAARQLGLTPHLVLRSEENDPKRIDCTGNLLLNRMLGSQMHLMPRLSKEVTDLIPKMEKIAEDIKERTGEKSHIIRVGGSDILGIFAYISAFEELIDQKVADNFDDVVLAVGSGGTAAGLAIANHLTKSNLKIHAICVCDNPDYFYQHIQSTIDQLGLDLNALDMIDIIDGYKGRGYGLSSQEELDFIHEVALQTGVVLDPVYTGKATYGLVRELSDRPHRFRGKRVLFIHTGGIFGAMDGRLDDTMTQYQASTNQIIGYER